MKEKNDNSDSPENEGISTINSDIKLKDNNNNDLFESLIKFIDNIINTNPNKISKDSESKIISKFNEINNSGIDITLLLDKNNNTLLQHFIARDLDNLEIILLIINYYKKTLLNDNKPEQFFKWLINDNIHHQNFFEILIEKQYPLKKQIEFFNKTFLYINSGDNSLIYKLLKNRNNNLFHLVIKQNNIPILLYLYDKLKNYFPSTNILDITNNEGMTSLHISCFYSFKNMADNLLLLGCNINSKDNKGNTPLHYAVKAENFRLCKKLIVFGADKGLKNNENITPGDLAWKGSNFSIRKLFEKKFKFCKFCKLCDNMDSIVNKRRDNLLLVLIILFSAIKYYFFFKTVTNNKITNYLYITSFLFDIICILFIFYPKIFWNKLSINKKRSIIEYSFEVIFEQNDYNLDKIELLCPVCRIIKLNKSKIKHCIICNKCIDNWDHHCYWLNICINKDNYNLFRFFTIFLFFEIIFDFFTFLYISSSIKIFEPDFNLLNSFIFCGIICVLIILLYGSVNLIRQIYLVRKNKKIEEEKIVSLEDFLLNSNSGLINDKFKGDKERKDINNKTAENQSIEFQEINN